MPETPLEAEIRAMIAASGPMPVAQYMALCLSHPQHGYYVTRDPLGRAGDFTTAPEISQMFGELIGLWAVAVWRQMGAPGELRLIELGPGRGTMMVDALRASAIVPEFAAALSAHLVETSPVLRERQRQTLAGRRIPLAWHARLDEVPPGPQIILANEFIDALPVGHAVRETDGWHQRVVTLDEEGRLAWGVDPVPMGNFDKTVPLEVADAPPGAIYEWRSDALALDVAQRLKRDRGAVLIIDYGHVRSGLGETLQGLRAHAFADPLTGAGHVDLTAHVDFAHLAHAFRATGCRAQGPLAQAEFLRRLGIEARAARLKLNATPTQSADIDSALHRLTAPDQMGELFKVLGVADPGLGPLPGFDP